MFLEEHALGCTGCILHFEEEFLMALVSESLLPSELSQATSLYLGPTPLVKDKHSESFHRLSLEVALQQALHHERYEEAAALRDQLRRLEDSSP